MLLSEQTHVVHTGDLVPAGNIFHVVHTGNLVPAGTILVTPGLGLVR